MSYAIVGFGKIGQALAHAFARKSIDVTVASRRPPEALAPQARAIGPTVVAKSLRDALDADTIILAVPFMMLLLIVGRLKRLCKSSVERQLTWCSLTSILAGMTARNFSA
jgi:predicted dinucleotide-binding enzyme